MSFSFGHMMVLLFIVLVIFGAGKLPQVMGDVAKGIKAFKEGLRESDAPLPPASLTKKSDERI